VGKTSGVERLEALRVLAEAWALNESVVERHHHEGRVKRCPTLKPFVSQKRPPEKKKQVLAWFMSIAKADDQVSGTYADFAKAATTSALLNAPSLKPYFVYTYLPHQDMDADDDDDLSRWLLKAGTRVVRWQLSFWNLIPAKIRSAKQGHINVGAFGRLDVPLLVNTLLRKEFDDAGLTRKFALYTDADVMFARD